MFLSFERIKLREIEVKIGQGKDEHIVAQCWITLYWGEFGKTSAFAF